MIGVNLSGAEFGKGNRYGYDYIYPSKSDIAFYADRGVELVRLPFKWERMQKELGGELDPVELGRLQKFLADADSLGVKVIIDLHNYGRYGGKPVGTPEVPTAAFADFWAKMAAAVGDSPALAAYDLMNEPHDMGAGNSWKKSAQAAVDAIRAVDMDTKIHVQGTGWSSARHWTVSNEDLLINDPAGKIVYHAHVYFDNDNSGVYDGTFDQEGASAHMGAGRIRNFTDWLERHGVEGFIGEFAVPDTDPRWLEVLDNFLGTLEELGIDGTYWGAGPWFGNYPMGLRDKTGAERAQMDVLERYLAAPEAATVQGTDGDDKLDGRRGDDVIDARGGDDLIAWSAGADVINGGGGVDTVSYARALKAVDVDLAARVQSTGGKVEDRLHAVENVVGTRYGDRLGGDAAANALSGERGDDRLAGLAGADTLDGGEGSDVADYSRSAAGVRVDLMAAAQKGGDAEGDVLRGVEHLVGSAHADVLAGDARVNRIEGGAGNDLFVGMLKGGNDTLDGGAGSDTYDAGAAKSVTLSLADGGSKHIRLISIENLLGTAGRDFLTGDAGANRLAGRGGDDVLDGGAGADTLEGGVGNDVYHVDQTGDRVMELAGGGTDTVVTSVDYTLSDHVEKLTVKAARAVSVTGNEGDNTIVGDATDSSLSGAGGDDTITGGAGDEQIAGGAGDDRLSGGAGVDEFRGGAGGDHFIFRAGDLAGRETIHDFARAEGDRIDLSRLDANTGMAGDQKFGWIGQAGFSGKAGELRAAATSGGWQVQGDANGDGVADFTLLVKTAGALAASDFYL